jgi:hypothetical protein
MEGSENYLTIAAHLVPLIIQFNSIQFNSIQFFIINVPSLQQNANYRNSTVIIIIIIIIIIVIIQFNSILYCLFAESTATRPITALWLSIRHRNNKEFN